MLSNFFLIIEPNLIRMKIFIKRKLTYVSLVPNLFPECFLCNRDLVGCPNFSGYGGYTKCHCSCCKIDKNVFNKFSNFRDETPKVSYLKAIDIWVVN